jgi:hypothetical protein
MGSAPLHLFQQKSNQIKKATISDCFLLVGITGQ